MFGAVIFFSSVTKKFSRRSLASHEKCDLKFCTVESNFADRKFFEALFYYCYLALLYFDCIFHATCLLLHKNNCIFNVSFMCLVEFFFFFFFFWSSDVSHYVPFPSVKWIYIFLDHVRRKSDPSEVKIVFDYTKNTVREYLKSPKSI